MRVTRVAICAGCAEAEVGGGDPRALHRAASNLAGAVKTRGLAVFESSSEFRRFRDSLTETQRGRWLDLCEKAKLVCFADRLEIGSFSTCDDLRSLERTLDGIADVVVCRCDQARDLGIDGDPQVSDPQDGRPVVAALPDWELVPLLDPFQASTSEVVQEGTDREAVWATSLVPLVRHLKKMVVLDRYSLHNEERTSKGAGFAWFIERLSEARQGQRPMKLEAFVQETDVLRRGVEDEREFLGRVITTLGLIEPDPHVFSRIDLFIADSKAAVAGMHDRGIALDGRVVWIGTGLSVFSSRTVRQATSIHLGELQGGFSQQTTELQRNCRRATWKESARCWVDPDGTEILL